MRLPTFDPQVRQDDPRLGTPSQTDAPLDGRNPHRHVRAHSLDALRGLAIIGMMIADNVPWSGLPAWMYHGQEPPPSHDFNPAVTGITWVDLVFPFFLFSMGAAIPLAQSNRDAERPAWQNGLLTVCRGLLLVAFAILNQHVRPEVVGTTSGMPQWAVGTLGFLLALGMFGRMPTKWPKWISIVTKCAGWGGAIYLLSRLHYPDAGLPRFNKERSDVIILVLATVSVFGTYAWRVTRNSFEVRAGLIAAIFAFKISTGVPGSWEATAWAWAPQGWIFNPKFLGYLLIALPGTIAGQLLSKQESDLEPDLFTGLACLIAIAVALIVFFQHANPMLIVAYAASVAWLAKNRLDSIHRPILWWGLLWLTLGCLLDPFEGGIKKDPYTLSYLFTTAGLASFALVGLAQFQKRTADVFTSVGKNPLLAYQAVTVLIPAVWPAAIAPFVKFLPENGWLGMAETLLKTALLVLLVAGFSRLRITMRV